MMDTSKELLQLFINMITDNVKTIPWNKFPIILDSIIYDPGFKSQAINYIPKETLEDEWKCYNTIFYSIYDFELTYICDSQDLEDGPENGDYDIYAGKLMEDFVVIHYSASHEQTVPDRMIIIGELLTYELWSCKIGMEIYNTDQKTYSLIKNNKDPLYIEKIKYLFKTQDRPNFYKIEL